MKPNSQKDKLSFSVMFFASCFPVFDLYMEQNISFVARH